MKMIPLLKRIWSKLRDKLGSDKYRRPSLDEAVHADPCLPSESLLKLNTLSEELNVELADTRKAATSLMETLVQRSEIERRRLELVFDSLGEAIIIVSESGEVAAINATARRLFGTSSQEVKGKSICRLLPSFCSRTNLQAEVDNYRQFMKRTGCAASCDTCPRPCSPASMSDRYAEYLRSAPTDLNKPFTEKHTFSDGRVLDLKWVTNVLTLNPNAEEFSFIIVIRDNTMQKRLEHDVGVLRLAYENMMDITPVPMFSKDENKRFTSVNDQLLDLLDLSSEEVIGKTAENIFDRDSAVKLDELDELATKAGGTQQITLDLKTLKGLVKTVRVVSRAVQFEDHTVISGSIITDTVDAQLREAVFAAASKAVLFTDPSGSIVGCNDELLRILGKSKSEVIGKPASDLGLEFKSADSIQTDKVILNGRKYTRMCAPVVDVKNSFSGSICILIHSI